MRGWFRKGGVYERWVFTKEVLLLNRGTAFVKQLPFSGALFRKQTLLLNRGVAFVKQLPVQRHMFTKEGGVRNKHFF